MEAIVVGSTGLVGSELVKQLDMDSDFSKISALVRKKTENKYAKVKEVEVDFEKLPENVFNSNCVVFCCLGTTIKKAGSKEAFRKVDFEFPLNTARIAKQKGVKCFAIITAMGSDSSSVIFYNQVKGEIENALTDLQFDCLGIFRPSMLLGERAEFRLGERVGQKVMNFLGFLIPKNYKAIHGQKVAAAMLEFAKKTNKAGKQVILSGDMY